MNSDLSQQKEKRARICMISDDFMPAATGVGVHLQCIARELAQRGHHLCIITTRRKGEPAEEIWEGVKVYRTFTLKIYGFYQALPFKSTVKRILEENKIKIIHYHYLGYLAQVTRKLAKSMDVKNIYTYHMTVDHLTQPLLMRPFKKLIAKQIRTLCNSCDQVSAPSQNLLKRIEADGVRVPLRYITNPVMTKEYAHAI